MSAADAEPERPDASDVVLRARLGEPLLDPGVRDVVVSTAEAIGERLGIRVAVVDVSEDSITVRVAGGRIAAMGLAAELRRTTDRWHEGRTGAPLWDPLREGGGA